MRKKIFTGLCLIALLLCGCSTLESWGITPERVESAGETVGAAGKALPCPPGAAVEILGWILAAAGVGWGAWKRTQGNKYKKAFIATARGIDKAEEGLPEDALAELHDALFKEQAKAGSVEVVAELRGKN